MQSNTPDSDRITESTISGLLPQDAVRGDDPDTYPDDLTDYFERETHFVGDSMTAEAIDNTAEAIRELRAYMENTFAQITMRIDHIARHDRAFPTEGCEYCGVPSAA